MKKRAERILAALREIEKEAAEIAKSAPAFTMAARKLGSTGDLIENWVRTQPDEPEEKTGEKGRR